MRLRHLPKEEVAISVDALGVGESLFVGYASGQLFVQGLEITYTSVQGRLHRCNASVDGPGYGFKQSHEILPAPMDDIDELFGERGLS